MSISLSPNLPSNVVEIGVEIAQAKLDAINNGSSPTSGNPFTTVSYVAGLGYLTTSAANAIYSPIASPTFTGTVTIPAGASISGYLTTASASSTYQTQAGMTAYAPKASPTFTGTVTIPAGASISGYLTTASAASTYQTIAGMGSYLTTSSAASTYQTQFGMSNYLTTSAASATYQTISGMSSYLTTANAINIYAPKLNNSEYPVVYDVPSDGVEYVRKNQTWVTPTGGGGGLTISTLSNGATSTLDSTAPTTGQALTFDGTDLAWATVGGGGVAWGGITGTVTDQTDLVSYITGLGYLTSVPTKTVLSTGGTHTLVAGDQNKIIFLNAGSANNNLTVPADSTYAFPNGTEITIVCDLPSGYSSQIGGEFAGQPAFNGNAAWTVTITNPVSKLVKVATDTWYYS